MPKKVPRLLTIAGLTVAGLAVALAAGCASPPGESRATVEQSTATDAGRAVVPQVATLSLAEVDKLMSAAGLVPILRYEPGVVSADGTVIGSDPPAGALTNAGGVVTVIVAGRPGPTLDDYVAAHRDLYVGIGLDANGVIVVGIHQRADVAKELAELGRLTNGAAFRVQTCARSWADLHRVQIELTRRDFLPDAGTLAFAVAIDPLACAVRLTADLSDADVAQLTAKYQGALVIQKGTAKRGG